MGEFTVINTQEEFDARIKDRLERERKTLSDKYADYEDIKKKATEYEAQVSKLGDSLKEKEAKTIEDAKKIEELTSKMRAYEIDSAKTKIALELGLPHELAGRLNGVTEEEIRKDAEGFAKFVQKKQTAPIGTNEPDNYIDDKKKGIRELAKQMNGGN